MYGVIVCDWSMQWQAV